MERMPVIFAGHGSPMNIVMDNEITRTFKALGGQLPRPKAVCVVSAHWMTRGTYVSCQPRLRQLYDFYGFPPELYQVAYEPEGAPEAALRAVALLNGTAVCDDRWGHDHAGWSVLAHMYPKADVPVFLVSVDMHAPPVRHLELARSIALLRDEGVLILGSGNIVHNLRDADFWNMDARPDPLGLDFDEDVKSALTQRDLAWLTGYERHGDAARHAVPTPDHYLPMLWAAALAEDTDELTFFNEVFQNRTVSMRGFMLTPKTV